MLNIGMLGECMIELKGEPFRSVSQSYGGDTLNTAVYLSRCIRNNFNETDVKVHFVTAVGEDALSQKLVEKWVEEGIETDFVFTSKTRHCGLYFIQLDERGERSFQYWRNDSAAKYFFTEFYDDKRIELLAQLDYLLLSGISLAILPDEDKPKLIELLKKLKAKDVTIVFDGNFRPKLWGDLDISTIKGWYEEIYKLCDIALVTDEDEFAIFGKCHTDALLSRLHHYGVDKIVIKMGADGCLLSQFGEEKKHVATEKIPHVVDTTSAGDSFNAGFLYGIFSGDSLVGACDFGNYVAGQVIQYPGAIIEPSVKFIKK
ncbi:sugar kinase [Thorsellia kenyensis]|uniref:Sugar kinase n=1 Tax=Thorsellia kenyensis TaxID=1549888 RepID=A0ABV6CE90_9GAMM